MDRDANISIVVENKNFKDYFENKIIFLYVIIQLRIDNMSITIREAKVNDLD